MKNSWIIIVLGTSKTKILHSLRKSSNIKNISLEINSFCFSWKTNRTYVEVYSIFSVQKIVYDFQECTFLFIQQVLAK
jgi:hypothetical protein